VATGRSGFGLDEYTITVSGLNILLAPGTYWLQVTPIDSGSGRSFLSTTSGLNAVGTPPGNNGNSFFDSSVFGAAFSPASDFVGSDNDNFSLGVVGVVSAVPEPSSLAMVGVGALLGGVFLRRKLRAS
jgi:hypothetical protein